MSVAPSTRRTVLAAAALVAATCALVAVAVAVAATPKRITPSGVGTVKLGKTYASLRRRGQLGKVHPGCPLAGPGTRSAPLRSPLRGAIDLTRRSPRRIATIVIRGGATARGIGVRSSQSRIRRAFPQARFDHSTDEIFGITLVRVPKRGGGPLQFAVDTRTKRVAMIGVPKIPLCD